MSDVGQWRRAGMDGSLAGLDIAGCLARPSARAVDADALEYLLLVGEAAALAAVHRSTEGRE